jgi:hypothetical protein
MSRLVRSVGKSISYDNRKCRTGALAPTKGLNHILAQLPPWTSRLATDMGLVAPSHCPKGLAGSFGKDVEFGADQRDSG